MDPKYMARMKLTGGATLAPMQTEDEHLPDNRRHWQHHKKIRSVPTDGSGSRKKISFLFVEAGGEGLLTRKRMQAKRKELGDDYDASEVTKESLEDVPRDKTSRDSCVECIAYRAPALMGEKYDHVEIVYHDVYAFGTTKSWGS